jgi:dTDP-4-amino-4,6-dideoxygalactose transaminase
MAAFHSKFMTQKPVPFLDLITPHLELEGELVTAFRDALRTAAFIGGPQVEGFEREFADYCGTKYCVGVANGTDAVRFALIITEHVASQVLSLPMFPGLTAEQQRRVASAIGAFAEVASAPSATARSDSRLLASA